MTQFSTPATKPQGFVHFVGAGPGAVQHLTLGALRAIQGADVILYDQLIGPEILALVPKNAAAIEVGPADQPGCHIGPVVNERQYDQIQSYIQKGIDEGARLVAGGLGRPNGFNRGYYVKPTIFADVIPGMTIEREEIFGPVMVIMPFDSEEEALRLANDTPYGLTNYVQTNNGARRNRVALGLRSGMVQMNMTSREAGSPFGGIKASGRAREGGMFGLEEFLEVKAISGWDPSSE